ncbi:hypothetical protein AI29_10730 [bacteria symbiont BFo2 of Frankliniella occidentalis]|nr:hypothetical protein AI29_10730 [bacteria symbiont BFo2 of Frankliniella occidentalis]KYP86899.1 hypothetical protein WB60_13325 [bacteria symbiont BFo2 of Frankliniella occidentalis]KYP92980.1 hypothetical protein WB67_15140 [bacteria symbiont BFo2 of Frankliniella occidentalis]
MSERKYRHPQVNLRLPEELKSKVAELAESNGRSANAEMVAAIEAWVASRGVPPPNLLEDIQNRISELEKEIRAKNSK